MVVRGTEIKKTSSDNGAGFSYRNSYRKLLIIFEYERRFLDCFGKRWCFAKT
nr:MAG TPA: hypothetical protein [Caudoviricetes sp.]